MGKNKKIIAMFLLAAAICLNVQQANAQATVEGAYGSGSYRLIANCYSGYGSASFAYFSNTYDYLNVQVTFYCRSIGSDNWFSENAEASINDNYTYVTASTRRIDGGITAYSACGNGYINGVLVASAADYK